MNSSAPEEFDTFNDFLTDLKLQFNKQMSSAVEDEATDLWNEMIEREEAEAEAEKEEQEREENLRNTMIKFAKKIMTKPTVKGKVNQITRIEEILERLPQAISAKDLAELTGKPEPSVRRDLAQGVKKGLWERIGKIGSRGVKYRKL